VSGFSGDAGDAIAAPVDPDHVSNGMQFTTPDQDNDAKPIGTCAFGKGWWYRECSRSTLTVNTDKALWNADTAAFIRDVVIGRMMVKLC